MNRTEAKRRQVIEALEEIQRGDAAAELTAGHVMTAAPCCVRPETSVRELIETFLARQFRHLLVTDPQGRLVGVISDRDVSQCLGTGGDSAAPGLEETTASQLMSTDLVTIGPLTPLREAVQRILDEGISCLPVLVDRALLGILTNTDLHIVLRVLLEVLPQASSSELVVAAANDPHD